MTFPVLRTINGREVLEAYGTTEGAYKGWETRRRGRAEFEEGGGKPGVLSNKLLSLVKEGGFTYDPIHTKSPKKGFSVSVRPDLSSVHEAKEIEAEDIAAFITKVRNDIKNTEGMHLGGWLDTKTGLIHLDLSIVVKTKKEAARLLKEHKQLGVYDLETGETLYAHQLAAARAARFKSFLIPLDDVNPEELAAQIRKMAGGK